MTLLYFILVLGVTVLIHELGHFIFAKKAGVYVYEFSIGMGPKLFSFHRKNDETIYSIRLLPIGGFVSMAGEDMLDENKNIPKERQLISKKWHERFMTIAAGVLFNFLLALILLFFVGLFNGAPANKSFINSVEPDYPAYEVLKEGDQIVKINDKKIKSADMLSLELQIHKGEKLTFTVIDKDGIERKEVITPKTIEVDGVETYVYGFTLANDVEYGFFAAMRYAFTKMFSLLQQMVLIIFYLITGHLSLDSLAGPVGIFNIVGESAKAGFVSLMYLTAYLCINVGFMNFIPLPAFDGGRLLFLVIEKIKGSRVKPEIENTIHSIGFVLLMILMLFITFNDILRLFQ